MPHTQFRPTAPDELGRVAEFLASVFSTPPSSPLLSREFLRWKYFAPHPDWSAPRSYLLCSDAATLAHGALWPVTLLTPQGAWSGFNFIDWAADAARPGAGVALLQNALRLADIAIVLGGSAMARKILPAAGLRPSSAVQYFALPLRVLAQLACSWRWSVRTPVRLGRNLLLRLRAPAAPRGWSLDPAAPAELEPLLRARDGDPAGAARFARSAGLLEYYFRCPIVQSEGYLLRRGSAPAGYCVITHAERQARIVDAWVAAEDAVHWKALFALAAARARERRDACEIATITSNETAAAALRACGFLPRGSTPLLVCSRSRPELAQTPVFMQMLDCDAAFRNEGTPQFWT